jgi:hypothetical protein
MHGSKVFEAIHFEEQTKRSNPVGSTFFWNLLVYPVNGLNWLTRFFHFLFFIYSPSLFFIAQALQHAIV